ncbi:MAG: tetratricopeptide repeat protein [Candidatus Hodarchaeota archaeon]
MKQINLMFAFVLLVVLLFSNVNAQILTANRLGIGFNVGGQKIYCEDPSGFGFGIEVYARYKINPRFFSTVAFGYGELSDGTLFFDVNTYHTELITFDVKGGVNLITEGNIIPYGYLGLGAFHFKYHGPGENQLPGRFLGGYGDVSFIIGGGLEAKIKPTVALDIYMDYRFTTGDDLNNKYIGAKDGYLNIRAGATYYLSRPLMGGGSSKVKLTDRSPIDEIADEGKGESPDDELNILIEGLDSYDEAADANLTMEEYVRLKSRVDQLNDAIRQKELEIEELKAQLTIRKEKIADLEKNLRNRGGALAASLNVDLSDFAVSYEQALQHYYSREYDAAIYLFSMLLETSPTHKLVSNCQYWLGECYFGQGDYSMALDAFQKVLHYEQSFKKDDALLMMGRCYINLGDKETAITMFDQLMNEFPDSEYFQKAQQYANSL